MEDLELLLYLAFAIIAYILWDMNRELHQQTDKIIEALNKINSNETALADQVELVDGEFRAIQPPKNINDLYNKISDLPAEIAKEIKTETLGYPDNEFITLRDILRVNEEHLREIKSSLIDREK